MTALPTTTRLALWRCVAVSALLRHAGDVAPRHCALPSCNTWSANAAAAVPIRPLRFVEGRCGVAANGNLGAISLLQTLSAFSLSGPFDAIA